jgi:hypothetical protein
MTEDEANEAISGALQERGTVTKESPDYFAGDVYAAIQWEPTYVWRVGNTIWAIELSRGDRIPETTIKSMVALKSINSDVQPAFFVPEGAPFEQLQPVCRANDIALIVKTADEYEVLEIGAATQQPNLARIPDWLIQQLKGIRHLEPKFGFAIRSFSKKYERLVQSGASDDDQERLLEKTFLTLLKTNQHFAAQETPLKLLRFFEQNNRRQSARDHYFHTFNNFLLGCIILDKCHTAFDEFKTASLHGAECSSEYVWLLTVLFHDVGYPIQKHDETNEIIYGVPNIGIEQAVAERKDAWNSPTYRMSRAQLVSLFDYLSQPTISSVWTADPFDLPAHSLDKALERSFFEKGHGAASCMRMLADFFRNVPGSPAQRQFLTRHIFLAGLSIPFHDWPVRKFLGELGITKLKTSRFPFASLLMFVDSIQEDRRGDAEAPDILTGITVSGNHVGAQIEMRLLTGEKLSKKKREVREVKDFLEEDLLFFNYPPELLL